MAEPAYTRMQVDERRAQLLELGADLFARFSYDELSMARFAKEAGISKALLYHYFPSKKELFVATLQRAAGEVLDRATPDPSLPPAEALSASVAEFLGWIEENPVAYEKLMQSSTGVPEVRDLVAEIRQATAAQILEGLAGGEPAPKVRAAVSGWLWFMDAAIIDWLDHGDIERLELRDFLLGSLMGSLLAAGWQPAATE